MTEEVEYIMQRGGKITNVVLFLLMLFTGGVLFFVLPKQKVSVAEKRKITPLPSYSTQKLINSEYTDSIDLFYSDNFIFRNYFINWASTMREHWGIVGQDIQFYNNNNQLANKENHVTKKDVRSSVDSTFIDEAPVNMPYENLNSVIVSNKRALQMFAGSHRAAEQYAALLKLYKETFNNAIKIHCMAVPVGSDFYLPAQLNKKKEKEFIDYFYSVVDNDISCVRAYDELVQHKKEYIQFNTDHHWTVRGAYYAYLAFCKSAGFAPLGLDQMTRKVIPNFLGTLYYYTQAEILKENLDSVEYFKIPYETKVTVFKSGISKGSNGSLYIEKAKGGNAYGVFLGADFPLMRVISPVKNGKKIVMFKDSYGNAFAHFLAAHYEEVFIIDYRYFNGNFKNLVNQYGITDILFAHNVYVVNSGFTISREKGILLGTASEIKKDKKADTAQKK